MSRIRLVLAVALTIACAAPVVLDAPAPRPEHQPIRVRPGHARVQAPADSATPVRLTALEMPSEPDSIETPSTDVPTPDETVDQEVPAARSLGSGLASYYGSELAGNATASGERFDPSGLTAAHRTLPFGTRVEVTNPRTGASVVVRINDRGPFHGSRLIDLSHEAARQIGIARAGTGRVELAVVEG